MSIKKFAVEPTARLHLRDANDEPMFEGDAPCVAVVYGPGAKQYAKAQAKQNNAFMDSLKKKGKTEVSADQKAAQQAAFLADITDRLENVVYEGSDGEPLDGRELAIAVYSDISLGFISDQIAKHTGDWANFTKGNTKS